VNVSKIILIKKIPLNADVRSSFAITLFYYQNAQLPAKLAKHMIIMSV